MGTSTIKDIYDLNQWKDIADSLKYHVRLWPPFPDPIGPVKYDAIDWIISSYQHTLPNIEKRIEAIEQHLEHELPEGKPFIRPHERPSVGDEALQQFTDTITRLTDRLDSIEDKLKKQG